LISQIFKGYKFLKMTVLHEIVVIEYQYNKKLMSMCEMSKLATTTASTSHTSNYNTTHIHKHKIVSVLLLPDQTV